MPKYLKTKEGSLEQAVLEAVSPAQQAAIAISKKEKGEKIKRQEKKRIKEIVSMPEEERLHTLADEFGLEIVEVEE